MGSEMMLLGHKKQENIKSNFTQTCNRFSQFLKERRSLGHLDAFKGFASSELDIKGAKDVSGPRNNATAINLLSKNMGKDKVSFELFPLTNSRAKAVVDNSTKDMADCREMPIIKEESKNNTTTPSMTIFYGGKVLVLNELPEDKAQEIMSLATRGTMSSSGSQAQTETQTLGGINPRVTHHLTQGHVLSQGASSLSDFPIARRVSLHRFIEKRKHRIAANAPYQLHKEAAVSHPQNSDMMRGLQLYEHQQLELKL